MAPSRNSSNGSTAQKENSIYAHSEENKNGGDDTSRERPRRSNGSRKRIRFAIAPAESAAAMKLLQSAGNLCNTKKQRPCRFFYCSVCPVDSLDGVWRASVEPLAVSS
jgi:hypothetical protein